MLISRRESSLTNCSVVPLVITAPASTSASAQPLIKDTDFSFRNNNNDNKITVLKGKARREMPGNKKTSQSLKENQN